MSDENTRVEVEQDTAVPNIETVARSPRTHVDSSPLPTDSMVTVPLSEADAGPEDEEDAEEPRGRPQIVVEERRRSSRASSSEIRKAFGRRESQASVDASANDSPTVSINDTDAPTSPETSAQIRRNSGDSGKSEQVDWAELEKKEEQQPEGEEEVWFSTAPRNPMLICDRLWPYCLRGWSKKMTRCC